MIDFKEKANLIWSVADLLRGDYKQADYGKVILPMTVLRRLDCILEPTKQKVLDALPRVEKLSPAAIDATLNRIAKLNFHNRSQYNFKKLAADPKNIAANLRIILTASPPMPGRSSNISISTIISPAWTIPNQTSSFW